VTFKVAELPTVVDPLLHEYVPPPVAVKLIDVVVHVSAVVAGAVIAAVGAVMFCVIVIDSVSVHPFAEVTVTVYVPAAVTFKVAELPTVVDPLLHEYVPPPVAVKLIDVVEQVSTVVAGAVIAAVGAVMFCVIVIDSVSVHPFAEVTVTVYVPAAVTFKVAELPTVVDPLLHEYVPPPVAVKLIDVVVQVSTVVAGAVIAAVGAVMFCVIVIDSVSVHPFAEVTVTVYVPAAVTFKVAELPTVVDPLLHEYVPPPVAVKLIDVVVHVSAVVAGAVIAAVGAVMFCVIVIDSVSVHPFAEVTVTVYVPAAVTFKVAELPTVVDPLLHEYVPPPVAVKLIDVVVQVSTVVAGAVIAAVGAVMFCVIVIDSVSVHPFAEVTVTV
jgi:hypothetical protein